jgi:endoglucanase Acf2
MGVLSMRAFWTCLLKIGLTLACSGLLPPALAQADAPPSLAPVGAGAIWLAPRVGESVRPRSAPYRTGEMLKRAVATNTWYSSLMYGQWSDVLHAHPLTFKATEQGMEMGLPQARTGPISLLKEWAKGSTGTQAVVFPHVAHLTVRPLGFTPEDARLQNAGDWNISVDMRKGQDFLRSHILHGSPMAYFELSTGQAQIRLGADVRVSAQASQTLHGKQVHYLESPAGLYALYLPPAAQVRVESDQMILTLPTQARYFSMGLLATNDDATREAYARSAFAFVENTEVNWTYDEAESLVRTRYHTRTRAMDGVQAPALMGLYPHHRKALAAPAASTLGTLPSVRGPITIAVGDQFETSLRFHGLLPLWPQLQGAEARTRLAELMVGDRRRAGSMFGRMGNGTYWTGKTLGALAQLMNIAEQQGDDATAAELESTLKQRMQTWFSGKSPSYFAHEAGLGTVLGYPEEYFSVSAMNDHHFHYGYWIMAAAQLARRDPQWAAQTQWGGMVNLLVRDIATAQRKRVDFPFLRNFDVYEGHSWARGNSEFFGLGNDQESSSEAIHAWAAIAQWGEITRQPALKALGVYLYATEVSSVLQYWFNIDGNIFDPQYKKPLASMVFGGGYGYSTWWTEEPRQILGINLLPITPASTYLAQLPTAWIEGLSSLAISERQTYDRSGQSDDTPKDIWQDIFASLLAIKNPAQALSRWNPRGSVEMGETRSHTHFWLHSLHEMGVPDTTVWANAMGHTVLRNPVTGRKTYLAYNSANAPLEVRFSDGFVLTVPARQVARMTAP